MEQPEEWEESYYDYWIDGDPCSPEEYKAGKRQTIIQYLGEDYVLRIPEFWNMKDGRISVRVTAEAQMR